MCMLESEFSIALVLIMRLICVPIVFSAVVVDVVSIFPFFKFMIVDIIMHVCGRIWWFEREDKNEQNVAEISNHIREKASTSKWNGIQ